VEEINEENTQKYSEEEVKKAIEKKTIEYLKVNEAVIVSEALIFHINKTNEISKKLAQLFVGLKKNYVYINVWLYAGRFKPDMWGYSLEDITISGPDIPSLLKKTTLEAKLPNGLEIALITLGIDTQKLLEKENYNLTEQYSKELERLMLFIKQLAINMQVTK